ncbi:MAG: hypothetical protein IPP17_26680 [Bacteroidetes bacterium]|nr:hypothetical protein [Bacteroidota bacterium]
MRATSTSFDERHVLPLFGPNIAAITFKYSLFGPNSPVPYNNCTAVPGTITSGPIPSGCLTSGLSLDGSVQLAGLGATLSCVVCGGGLLETTLGLRLATPVCNNLAINDASSGPGIVAEGCSGCNTSEAYTNWYRI